MRLRGRSWGSRHRRRGRPQVEVVEVKHPNGVLIAVGATRGQLLKQVLAQLGGETAGTFSQVHPVCSATDLNLLTLRQENDMHSAWAWHTYVNMNVLLDTDSVTQVEMMFVFVVALLIVRRMTCR